VDRVYRYGLASALEDLAPLGLDVAADAQFRAKGASRPDRHYREALTEEEAE
jgi:hypothetical protein